MLKLDTFLSAFSVILLTASILMALFLNVGFTENVAMVVDCQFVLYVSLIAVDFLLCKHFTLFQIWIASFIFIILSEMIILAYEEYPIDPYIPAISYLIIANDILLLGYIVFTPSSQKNKTYYYELNKPAFFLTLILFIELIYVISNISLFALALSGGSARGGDMGNSMGNFEAFTTLMDGCGLFLPALIAYYFKYYSKKSIWFSILLMIPVLLIHILVGTRFRLLFAILPYLIIVGVISFSESNLKKNVIAVVAVLCLALMSSLIRDLRTTAVLDIISNGGISVDNSAEERSFMVRIADKMSPEGVVYMTKLSDDYFATHPHHYGKEAGFILYFWIPRFVWPNKPTQLDHWLIREVENVSDAHSSASGFSGELKADFGYFSLLFIFLMGCYLKKADIFIRHVFSQRHLDFTVVIASAIVPYIFFFVRSPLASSYSFIFELVMFFILRRFLFERKELVLNGRK